MKSLIKHIVRKAINTVVGKVWEDHDTDDIVDRAVERIVDDVRHDRHFNRSVAAEIDLDAVAEKVGENFEPDYAVLADNIQMSELVDTMRESVVEEIMEKLPTPLQALIEMPTEAKIDISDKPELVNRLIDRAAEMLINMAADMADKGELDE